MPARRDLLSLTWFVVAVLVYAWPLVRSLTTAMPGSAEDRDVATFVWNVGWVRHALPTPPALLYAADVLAPFGADLRLHTYGLLLGLAVAPLVDALGVYGAFNLALLASLSLNGILTCWLVQRQTRSRPAGLLAGTCLMLASAVLAQMRVGRPSFACLWLVVACVMSFEATLACQSRAGRLGRGLLLGVLLFAAALADLQMLLYSGLWLGMRALGRLRDPRLLPSVPALGLCALGFGLLFGPIYGPALAAGYQAPALADMREYSFRYFDYLTPDLVQDVYGYDLLLGVILGLILAWRQAGVWWWLGGGLVCLLLALGPVLQPTSLSLPFALLSQAPGMAQFRTPSRLVIPAVLGLAVVLGSGVAGLHRHWPGLAWLVPPLLVVRLGLAMVHDPFVTQTYPAYETYRRLAAEPARGTLVEVPLGIRSGLDRIGHGAEVLEVYQSVHGKPLINAMIARLPAQVFAAYRAEPAAMFLAGEAESASFDQFNSLLSWVGADYVLLHRDLVVRSRADAFQAYFDAAPALERAAVEGDLVLYRVVRLSAPRTAQ